MFELLSKVKVPVPFWINFSHIYVVNYKSVTRGYLWDFLNIGLCYLAPEVWYFIYSNNQVNQDIFSSSTKTLIPIFLCTLKKGIYIYIVSVFIL